MNLYVYGFVLVPRGSVRRTTMGGHRLELLRIADIDVAIEKLDGRPTMSESALRGQHAIVDRLARRFDAILPARFGSFLSLDELERVVSTRRLELRKALRNVRRRVQMTVRIITPVVPDTSSRHAEAAKSGTAYLNARRVARSGSAPHPAADLTEAVGNLLRDERVEIDRAHGSTALFHLIDRSDVRRYRASMAGIALRAEERVRVTGPFAPFAFVPELWP